MSNQLTAEQKKKNKEAADRHAERHWMGKYTTQEHLSETFLAGMNYQRQISNNGSSNAKSGESTGE